MMHVLPLWALLLVSPAAKPETLVNCPDAPGTPCRVVNGRYVHVLPEPAPPPRPALPAWGCLEDEDNKVCGYQCLKNYGQMKCAATPQGRCASTDGKVACWDPPAPWVAFMGGNVESANCVANYGEIACGYHCVEHSGHVGCSQTPMGQCAGNFGVVTCFDPPLSLLPLFQGNIPQAQCLEAFGKIACGYRCVAQFGEVKCAVTPQGACTTKGGRVLCFDPPTSEIMWTVAAPTPTTLPDASCLEERGKVACGYNCLANEGDVACASSPRGSCTLALDGRVACVDPSPR